MGGTGFEVTVTPIDGRDGSAVKLYEQTSDLVVANIQKLAGRGRAVAAVLANYDRDYAAKANEEIPLHFGFYDGGGGCFLSMDLLTHWFELVLASLREAPGRAGKSKLQLWTEELGFRVPPPERSLREVMSDWAKEEVFVELRGRYYGAQIFEGAPTLSSDDFPGHLTYATLGPEERALVDDLLAKHACACGVCRALGAGKRAGAYVPKRAPKPLEGTVSRKKRLYFENDPSMTEVPAEVESAKQLKELVLSRVPIVELPAWLGDRKLDYLSLSFTNVTRLPRLPATLTWLSLSYTPIASLEELALPALRRFTLMSLPASAVASLDLRGLPALQSLTISGIPIEELPRGIEASKLESLHLSQTGATDVRPACVSSLKTLILEHTAIGVLPEAIGECAALESVQIRETPIRGLPASLARVPKLSSLLVERTELGPWRTWIEHVPPTVKELYVSASVLPASDHGEVKRFLPNATIVSR